MFGVYVYLHLACLIPTMSSLIHRFQPFWIFAVCLFMVTCSLLCIEGSFHNIHIISFSFSNFCFMAPSHCNLPVVPLLNYDLIPHFCLSHSTALFPPYLNSFHLLTQFYDMIIFHFYYFLFLAI